MPEFHRRSPLPVSAETAFDWHEHPEALERLCPPWQGVRVLQRPASLADGSRAVLSVPLGPWRWRWVAEHRDYLPGRQFKDVQVRGPFARWIHTHGVEPLSAQRCVLDDHVEYALPLGALGRFVGGAMARRQLEQVFTWRHVTTRQDLVLQASRGRGGPLRILVSGSSGLVGSDLVAFLRTGGHDVLRLVRTPHASGAGEVAWDPAAGRLEGAALEGLDAVIHLGGEGIASRRWTAARKARIRDSRVEGTTLLARRLAALACPPRVFACASAVGIYGDRGDAVVDEDDAPGCGFLADVCRAWEAACEPARTAGIRVVNLRLGVVLSSAGGALAKMLTPFKLGLGGRLGSGRQAMSWIALDDVVGVVHQVLVDERLVGPLNVAAPEAVTNAEFTRTLARVLRRPAVLSVPGFVARLAFGSLANEALLVGARVRPKRLLASGYEFLQPDLEGALRRLLGRVRVPDGGAGTSGPNSQR